MESNTMDIPLPDEPPPEPSIKPVSTKSTENVTSPNTTNVYNDGSQPIDATQLYQNYYNAYAYAAYHQHHQQYSYYVPIVPVMPIQQQTQPVQMTKNEEDDDDDDDDDNEDDDDDPTIAKKGSTTKANNILPLNCNEMMNLNPLLYQNIQQSPYFKNNLFQLKTYHEVIDEIFYSVKHLEPWEKGSRKVGGQTGMCGSVRGVGAGGIISTPYCILFKLFTLKLTRKQLNGLIRHKDSAYIRSLGFMYVRYTQPPAHLWQWYEPFLDDEEEVDPKAGGGQPMTIGQMCRHMLTKLDWFSTLFPRVPVPIQKDIESKLKNRDSEREEEMRAERGIEEGEVEDDDCERPDDERYNNNNRRESKRDDTRRSRRSRERKHRSRSHERRSRSRDRHRKRSKSRSPTHHRHGRDDYRDRERDYRHRHKNRH